MNHRQQYWCKIEFLRYDLLLCMPLKFLRKIHKYVNKMQN